MGLHAAGTCRMMQMTLRCDDDGVQQRTVESNDGVRVGIRAEKWSDPAQETSTRDTPSTPDTPSFPLPGVACMVTAHWVTTLRST